ncbi:metal ABC transporter substrate-binding protein [Halalkalibacterium ligniniphilum]|uniref:metal ABC transporter substrate-binding protein n=1 Tax=Halalkalibacterium ligniniphilum TaxID=1134413 RepID=UPI000346AC8F|nr:metal ABC transporter substrate-binding protein [Halalkalibacterium ligniniphilum]
MRKKSLSFLLAGLISVVLVACGEEEPNQDSSEEEGLQIVTSFSILADLAQEVAGDRSSVEYIVPIGEDPHGYEPVPSDFQKVSDSDVFYVNGLGLEGWLQRLVENVGDVNTVEVSQGLTTIPLEGQDGEDPHAWLAVSNAIHYVEVIRDDLIERDPEGKAIYTENAEAYIQELEELDSLIQEELSAIEESKRTIVVSENAFRYFGEAYGIETEGIWELNSHEEGTPGQIARVVDLIQDKGLPAVFVETTVNQQYMETVASNANVTIAGEVYTDAVGLDGSGAETYITMMEHNARTFADGLTQ